jgi:hypothetical protein
MKTKMKEKITWRGMSGDLFEDVREVAVVGDE